MLIVISPLLLGVAIWLHFANKGAGSLTPNPIPADAPTRSLSPTGEGNWLQRWLQPVIFTQERPGKDAKIFKVIKFYILVNAVGCQDHYFRDLIFLQYFDFQSSQSLRIPAAEKTVYFRFIASFRRFIIADVPQILVGGMIGIELFEKTVVKCVESGIPRMGYDNSAAAAEKCGKGCGHMGFFMQI